MRKILKRFIDDLWLVGWKEAKAQLKQGILRLIADMLPKQIAYYACIRVWAYASSGKWETTDATAITVSEAIARWEKQ